MACWHTVFTHGVAWHGTWSVFFFFFGNVSSVCFVLVDLAGGSDTHSAIIEQSLGASSRASRVRWDIPLISVIIIGSLVLSFLDLCRVFIGVFGDE